MGRMAHPTDSSVPHPWKGWGTRALVDQPPVAPQPASEDTGETLVPQDAGATRRRRQRVWQTSPRER